MGAGGGEVLVALRAADPSLRLLGVDVTARPAGLPDEIGWSHELPTDIDGRGEQRLGGAPADDDARWIERWWPLREVGDRAEVGGRATSSGLQPLRPYAGARPSPSTTGTPGTTVRREAP